MRDRGVRKVLVYCRNHHCIRHAFFIWPDASVWERNRDYKKPVNRTGSLPG
jgi:hypothetical protein